VQLAPSEAARLEANASLKKDHIIIIIIIMFFITIADKRCKGQSATSATQDSTL